MREKGRQILAAADEETRADLAEALADEHAIDALDFLLTLLDTDPSADVRVASDTVGVDALAPLQPAPANQS